MSDPRLNVRLQGAERAFLDHALAMVAACTATYSIALSIGNQRLGLIMALTSAIAFLAGYGLSRVTRGTRFADADGWLFAAMGLLAVPNTLRVNQALGDEGFPIALLAAVMMWLLIMVGGLASWRDSTLLFTTLPGIALFGLVGTIDSWRPGVWLFCIFLLCSAVLYARTHQRAMLDRAVQAGADPRFLWRDVWRWVAGPEWAFAAAGIIILFSFAGAPVLQGSLQGVSDTVRNQVQNQMQAQRPPPSAAQGEAPEQTVGNGPSNLSDRIEFYARIAGNRYLRRAAYARWTGRGWSRMRPTDNSFTLAEYSLRASNGNLFVMNPGDSPHFNVTEGEAVDITLRARGMFATPVLMAPGPVLRVRDFPGLALRADAEGITSATDRLPSDRDVSFVAWEAKTPFENRAVLPGSRVYTDASSVNPQVLNFAREAIAGARTDYEKARSLSSAIGNQARYNLNAARVPAGVDPVVHFLFTSKEGYCDLFASAFVQSARSVGLPARYVTGYLVNELRPDQEGFFPIRERDGHAWAEVYFEGTGWVTFDPTEFADEVEGAGRGDQPTPLDQWIRNVDWYLVGQIAIGGTVVTLLAIGIWIVRRPRVRLAPNPALGVVRLQNRFQLGLERATGHPRRFSQTLREYVDRTAGDLGPHHAQAVGLAQQFEDGMFSPRTPDKTQLQTMTQEVESFLKEVRAFAKAARQAGKK